MFENLRTSRNSASAIFARRPPVLSEMRACLDAAWGSFIRRRDIAARQITARHCSLPTVKTPKQSSRASLPNRHLCFVHSWQWPEHSHQEKSERPFGTNSQRTWTLTEPFQQVLPACGAKSKHIMNRKDQSRLSERGFIVSQLGAANARLQATSNRAPLRYGFRFPPRLRLKNTGCRVTAWSVCRSVPSTASLGGVTT